MDFILGFFAGYLLNWVALSILLVLSLFCEVGESPGWAVFFGAVAGVVAINLFGIPLNTVLYAAVGYLVLGVLWSIWRYKRFVRTEVQRLTQLYGKARTATEDLHPSKQTGRIVSWMVIWPVSLISNITGEFIHLLSSIVTTWLKGIYEDIYKSGVASTKKVDLE